jgi:two-component system, NarL family, nitrate/nitrite response regulator NarL
LCAEYSLSTHLLVGFAVDSKFILADAVSDAGALDEAFRILIIADVRLYREGMQASFAKHSHFEVVGTASSTEESRTIISGRRPHVAIIDMATRHSLSMVRAIRDVDPELLIVGFGVEEVIGEIVACAEAGLAGYIPSDASLDDVVEQVESVCRGELLCSPHIAAGLFRSLAVRIHPQQAGSAAPELTRREREVLRLIDDGLSNKMIARSLGIEVSTVKNHVHNLLEKLQVESRMQAAASLGAHMTSRHRSYHAASDHNPDADTLAGPCHIPGRGSLAAPLTPNR